MGTAEAPYEYVLFFGSIIFSHVSEKKKKTTILNLVIFTLNRILLYYTYMYS